jgi:hypothetical protein
MSVEGYVYLSLELSVVGLPRPNLLSSLSRKKWLLETKRGRDSGMSDCIDVLDFIIWQHWEHILHPPFYPAFLKKSMNEVYFLSFLCPEITLNSN